MCKQVYLSINRCALIMMRFCRNIKNCIKKDSFLNGLWMDCLNFPNAELLKDLGECERWRNLSCRVVLYEALGLGIGQLLQEFYAKHAKSSRTRRLAINKTEPRRLRKIIRKRNFRRKRNLK